MSPDNVSDVNANNMYTADVLSTEYNASDIDVRSNNEQRRDQDSRTDSRSTLYDDIFDVNPALQAVTFSSTLPLLDGNQEADEAVFLCELARANDDDTAYLPCSLGGRMAEWLRPADCEILTIKLRGINYQFAHLVFEESPYRTSRWFQSRPRFYMAGSKADILGARWPSG